MGAVLWLDVVVRHGWLVALRVTRGWRTWRKRATGAFCFLGCVAPPSVLPDISPSRGEIDSLQRPAITRVEDEMSGCIFPISPLEGEMPGRAEGGKLRMKSKNGSLKPYRFNSQVVTRSPVSLSLPSFN